MTVGRLSALVMAAMGQFAPWAAFASDCTQNPVGVGLAQFVGTPVASYRIDASLDARQHVIAGTETIRWKNPSGVAVRELYIHAYLNAFAHPRTRFLRAGTASHRTSTEWQTSGSITITRIIARELKSADLLRSLEQHSPNDPEDSTDLRLELPSPIEPAAVLTLDLDFKAQLPSLVDRSGFSGSFHSVAQWFPKIARLDQQGHWHHFAYDPISEFSSDFGDYNVLLDVPREHTIAAPGIPHQQDCSPNRRCERYCVEGVHDFAWFAWDKFVETKTQAGSVELRHYGSIDQTQNTRDTLDTVRWGLDHFNSQYFPYPYSSLTIVHPPDLARAAGGMEYPLLITTGGPWYLRHLGFHATEAVALHELAHQWFYGVVASDEYLFPVLDEGLASWAESRALRSRFGAGSFYDSAWLRLSEAAIRRTHARHYSRRGPAAIAAADFADFAAIGGRIYARFPTLLETVAACYGDDDLVRALRNYSTRYRFRHPTPQDFLDAVQSQLQPRAHRALTMALLSDGWVDYAVVQLSSHWEPARNAFANRVLVERRGTLDFPVNLAVEFANGHRTVRHLDTLTSSEWIEWPYSSPIVAATIDPEHKITLDDDLENQSVRIDGHPWLYRAATAVHLLVSTFTSLGWP